MSTISPYFFVREDNSAAANAAINIQPQSQYPTTKIYFEKGVLGAGTTGDLILDRNVVANVGTKDTDTTVWIENSPGSNTYTEYEFIVELRGTLPATNKVPPDLQGDTVTVITVLGLNKRLVFTTSPDGDFANMSALGPGGITLIGDTTNGPFSPICFTKGTLISCEFGEVAIEDLKCGDLVRNSDGKLVEIRWIGYRHIPKQSLMLDINLAPVWFHKNALGPNVPDRDLLVSQQHRMLIDNWLAQLMFDEDQVLVAAKHLVNDHSITISYPDEGVEYYHILFDEHQIITANGALSESFHPGSWGMSTLEEAARDEIFKIFPELELNIEAYGAPAKPSLKGYEAKALSRMMN